MIEKIKLALRIVDNDFDEEIGELIDACLADLQMLHIRAEELDPFILDTIKIYCKMNFGLCEAKDYARLKSAYDERKGQLMLNSYYRGE